MAVPVVFGLTLVVNLLFGYTINRVTLFALILSLGLLVDDPIVDVENIARHFALRGRATRQIVLEAVAEIRPPLITATLAVIVSFLPMFFITGMMGPYMRPMALNVPGGDAHVDGGGVHDHAVAGVSRAEEALPAGTKRAERTAADAGSDAEHDLDGAEEKLAVPPLLSAHGAAAALAPGRVDVPGRDGAADGRWRPGWRRSAPCR